MVVMFVRASQLLSRDDVAVDDDNVDDDGTIFRVVNNIVVKCILLVECVSDVAEYLVFPFSFYGWVFRCY